MSDRINWPVEIADGDLGSPAPRRVIKLQRLGRIHGASSCRLRTAAEWLDLVQLQTIEMKGLSTSCFVIKARLCSLAVCADRYLNLDRSSPILQSARSPLDTVSVDTHSIRGQFTLHRDCTCAVNCFYLLCR